MFLLQSKLQRAEGGSSDGVVPLNYTVESAMPIAQRGQGLGCLSLTHRVEHCSAQSEFRGVPLNCSVPYNVKCKFRGGRWVSPSNRVEQQSSGGGGVPRQVERNLCVHFLSTTGLHL